MPKRSTQPGAMRKRQRKRHLMQEASTLARASVSSGVATALDAVAYQTIVSVAVGSYGAAAFVGALLGGVTNFSINRRWAFANTNKNHSTHDQATRSHATKRLRLQVIEYAFASLVTYLALQLCLTLLVEACGVNPHVAWIPSKVVAWLGVSYPLHRFVVFARPKNAEANQGLGEEVSEQPPIAA